jgi:hypothetical protein
VKEKIIKSPTFIEASGSSKVEILGSFRRKYPDVDITELLLPAIAKKREEEMEKQAAVEREKKLSDLEKRIKNAEWDAQQARWSASTARAEAQDALRTRYYWQQYNYRCQSRPQPYSRSQIGGLSIGYESPNIRMNYSSGSRVFNRQIYGRKSYNNIGQHKIYSSSSSFPGF